MTATSILYQSGCPVAAADHHHEGDRTLRKPVLITVGVIVAILGAVFTFQGLGFIGGSAMTGSTLWAVLGPIIAVVGIALVVVGLRRGGGS
jgi:hypothetical protein